MSNKSPSSAASIDAIDVWDDAEMVWDDAEMAWDDAEMLVSSMKMEWDSGSAEPAQREPPRLMTSPQSHETPQDQQAMSLSDASSVASDWFAYWDTVSQ